MLNIVKFCDAINNTFTQRGLTAYGNYQETVEIVNQAQVSLMNAYRKVFEKSGEVTDAIGPFKVEETVAVQGGLLVPQVDWMFTVGMYYHDVYNDGCKVVHKDTEIPDMTMEQVGPSKVSSIRAPSLYKPKRYYTNGAWKIEGRPSGTVKHLYIRRPVQAEITSTVDPVTLEEIPTSQVNLEWTPDVIDKLLKICLFWRGVAVQDQFVVQAASSAL